MKIDYEELYTDYLISGSGKATLEKTPNKRSVNREY
jgi:hypothetical protein